MTLSKFLFAKPSNTAPYDQSSRTTLVLPFTEMFNHLGERFGNKNSYDNKEQWVSFSQSQ